MGNGDGIPIRDYIDSRFNELDKRLAQYYELTQSAVLAASKTLDGKLEHLNAFRAQMQEERLNYARKSEVDLRLCAVEEKVNTSGGRTAGKEWLIALIISVGALLINFFK